MICGQFSTCPNAGPTEQNDMERSTCKQKICFHIRTGRMITIFISSHIADKVAEIKKQVEKISGCTGAIITRLSSQVLLIYTEYPHIRSFWEVASHCLRICSSGLIQIDETNVFRSGVVQKMSEQNLQIQWSEGFPFDRWAGLLLVLMRIRQAFPGFAAQFQALRTSPNHKCIGYPLYLLKRVKCCGPSFPYNNRGRKESGRYCLFPVLQLLQASTIRLNLPVCWLFFINFFRCGFNNQPVANVFHNCSLYLLKLKTIMQNQTGGRKRLWGFIWQVKSCILASKVILWSSGAHTVLYSADPKPTGDFFEMFFRLTNNIDGTWMAYIWPAAFRNSRSSRWACGAVELFLMYDDIRHFMQEMAVEYPMRSGGNIKAGVSLLTWPTGETGVYQPSSETGARFIESAEISCLHCNSSSTQLPGVQGSICTLVLVNAHTPTAGSFQ